MIENDDHIHAFEDIIVPATCLERGYTIHRCACGYEHKDQFTPLGKHAYALTAETPPDCLQGGSQTYTCSVCKDTQTRQLAPLGHQWNAWAVRKFASCTEDGLQTRKCARCGEAEEYVIPATGHKCSRPQKNAQGQTEYYCLNCGAPMEKPAKEKKIRSTRKKPAALIITAIALLGALVAGFIFLPPVYHYYVAKIQIKQEKYESAFFHLLKCFRFKDTRKILGDFTPDFESGEEEIIYYNENGEETSRERSSYARTFDEHGNITFHTAHAEDGTVTYQYRNTYQYDNDGNMTQQIRYDEDGNQEYKYVYKYDGDGNRTWQIYYDEDGTQYSKTQFKYDSKDNCIEEIYYGNDDEIRSRYEYRYDSRGNCTEELCYNSSGQLNRRYEYAYDSNDYCTLRICYNADGELSYKCTYEYTKNGVLKELVEYDENGEITEKEEYELDKEGFQTHCTITNEAGEETRRRIAKYSYDKYGFPQEITRYTTINDEELVSSVMKLDLANKKVTVTNYGYDPDNGNLARKTIDTYEDLVVFYNPKDKK